MSPLFRALETAYHTFKNHLNFKEMVVILHPDVREHTHSPCDIPSPIMDTVNHFKGLFPNGLNTDLLDLTGSERDLWFL